MSRKSDPKEYAKSLMKECGPCDVVRCVTQKYPSLTRAQVLEIADALKINRYTASTQYSRVRSGVITMEL